uniref:Scaffold protein involved in DNA repair n=1 Tax=Amphilophus citrinellus TaxID=61819 RepID=A0A3Q0SKM5_AMPCI
MSFAISKPTKSDRWLSVVFDSWFCASENLLLHFEINISACALVRLRALCEFITLHHLLLWGWGRVCVFHSGGLAERLNRLQCRQRSAISFWKHQSISDTSAATTEVLAVLEVHEECSMQLAHCEHHQPPGDGHQLSNPVSEEKAHMLVLFNRETAAQLIPAPRDVIHLYPPCVHVLKVTDNVFHIIKKKKKKKRLAFNILTFSFWYVPRLCVLVQDSYGMFSVVQLHPLPCEDDLSQYCQMWQGKTCMLRGIKVVQRVTRESSRLFSLIDSLWPPAMPLKDHGNSLSMQSVSSHCRDNTAKALEEDEDQGTSPLYLQPTKLTLRDILQVKIIPCMCSLLSFCLLQNTDIGQGEVWLVLTDPSLQEEQPERPCRRTVALRVNTSCVLTSSVLKTLNSPAVCHMLFRDAIKEHGRALFRPFKHYQWPHLLPEPQAKTLPQPVRLDPLSLETTPNSLCTLTGVIVGVDESTAYSWPACNLCGSDNLELSAERPQNFHCASCKSVVDKPNTKIQLEVFLTTSSLRNCTMKVKVRTARKFPGYDVEAVLGKEVGPIPVYVRVITRKPALWMGLEEICL